MDVVVPVLVAVLGSGVTAAVVAGVIAQRQGTLERKRRACAEALSDALEWIELPYRIRRRLDDDPATLGSVRDQINALQSRLAFHESWLRVELPNAHEKYSTLLKAIKGETQAPIQGAWKAPPLEGAKDMSLGRLFEANFDLQIAEFANAVRDGLQFWRFWQ